MPACSWQRAMPTQCRIPNPSVLKLVGCEVWTRGNQVLLHVDRRLWTGHPVRLGRSSRPCEPEGHPPSISIGLHLVNSCLPHESWRYFVGMRSTDPRATTRPWKSTVRTCALQSLFGIIGRVRWSCRLPSRTGRCLDQSLHQASDGRGLERRTKDRNLARG